MKIDPNLLKKYDVYGPRYTSYPTALQFTPEVCLKDYYGQIEESNQDPIPKPVSLYLHVPFCHALCYYCGCHKIITNSNDRTKEYFDTLKQEIQLQASLVAEDRFVQQIHFGGGTPTFYDCGHLKDLLDTIRSKFTLSEDCEIGIEIDPRTTTPDDIRSLVKMGFNRMSFGIQDFDRDVQVAINRIQGREATLSLLEIARQSGVESISVDLIYGLPKQTVESFNKTLETMIDCRPDRIALYNYAHMPQRIKAQRLINSADIPSAEVKLDLLTGSIKKLDDAGYCYIGMDHFALPEDSLSQSLHNGTLQRNFQGYSTNADCDILGMGVSAISKINNLYSQNYKDTKTYQFHIGNEEPAIERGLLLTAEDHIRGSIIQSIMCSQTVHFSEFNKVYDLCFKEYFARELEELKPLAEDGLVILSDDGLTVTEKGRLLLRNIAMIFDAYMQQKDENIETIKFSKVL